jgi:IMP cyclohydrolase
METLLSDNQVVAAANFMWLSSNPYPGRGIIIGMDETGNNMVQVYWIMGRSANSRNRVFSSGEGGRVFTEAADPSKVEDASMIIYNAMLEAFGSYAVSNGSQTDVVIDAVASWQEGLQTMLWEKQYEPDPPNFTPRITGLCEVEVSDEISSGPLFQLSVLRKSIFGVSCDHSEYCFTDIGPGFGYGVTTYMGDGNPLPSWKGDPLLFPLSGSIDEIADLYFSRLNQDNMVSLVVKFIPLHESRSFVTIRNKYQKV